MEGDEEDKFPFEDMSDDIFEPDSKEKSRKQGFGKIPRRARLKKRIIGDSSQNNSPSVAYIAMQPLNGDHETNHTSTDFVATIETQDNSCIEKPEDEVDATRSNKIKKQFIDAIRKSDISKFNDLLPIYKDDINWVLGKDMNTPLHYAALEGNSQVMNDILKLNNLDINKQNKKKQTALHLAAREGHVEIVKILLLKRKTNLLIKDEKRNLPLHAAAYKGKERCCDVLVHHDSSQRSVVNKSGDTPLIAAAKSGHKRCCELLIDDTHINVPNKENDTPLHCAVKKGYYLTVTLLLEKGADYNVKDKENCSPTYLAAFHPCKDTLETLLQFSKSSINCHETNAKQNRTIFHAAASNSIDCLKLLIEKFGTKFLDVLDSEGNAPIHLSITNKMLECAELLINSQVKLNIINNDHKTILHLAIEKNLDTVLSAILSKDRSMINKKDGNNLSPLLLAAKSSNPECCKILIRRGSSTSSTDSNGKTALHIAAETNNPENCKTLLNKGKLTTEEVDDYGSTPFQSSVVCGYIQCCKILFKKSKSQLMIRNCNNKFLFELAFENRKDDVFSWILAEMTEYTESGADKFIWPKIHRFLHKSIDEKRRECIEGIIQSRWWKAGFRIYSHQHTEPKAEFMDNDLPCTNFNSIIKDHSDLAACVMNKCVSTKEEKSIYDYEIIENSFYLKKDGDRCITNPFNDSNHMLKKEAEEVKCDSRWLTSHVVNTMVEQNNLDLLKHSLVTSWINNKWLSYIGIFVAMQMLCRIASAFIISLLIGYMWSWEHFANPIEFERNTCHYVDIDYFDYNGDYDIVKIREVRSTVNTLIVLSAFVVIITFTCEVFKYYKLGKHYLKYYCVTIIRMIRITLILLFIIPTNNCDLVTAVRQDWQWQIGVIGTLFYWFQTINALNKIPALSIFLPITKTFIKKFTKILIFIFIIIISFGFIFHLILKPIPGFTTIGESIIKTTVWLRGDLAYDETFLTDDLKYVWLSKFIFIFFVTTVAAFLANLLISSPFNYIEEYRQTAELHKYALCVNTCLTCEMFFPPAIRKKWVVSKKTSRHIKTWKDRLSDSFKLFTEEHVEKTKTKNLEDKVEDVVREIFPQMEKIQAKENKIMSDKLLKVSDHIFKFNDRLSKVEEILAKIDKKLANEN